MANIEQVFSAFVAFGAGKKDEVIEQTLTGQKFSKFAKDCKIVGPSVTKTDVDIVFNKVKPKTARVIDIAQFGEALKQLAAIKHKKLTGDAQLAALMADIEKSGGTPKTAGATKTSTSNIVDRMTDTSAYTGTHKERFGSDGKGLGMAGKDAPPVKDLSQVTNRKEVGVRGV